MISREFSLHITCAIYASILSFGYHGYVKTQTVIITCFEIEVGKLENDENHQNTWRFIMMSYHEQY